jgi:predicted nuclease of predicted toxin-antitoxin system
MAKYLIDANLPCYFSLWNNPDFVFVKDIDDSWTDSQIWDYAKNNQLTIITKDADFSTKVLYFGTPPKVIHIKFGNLKIKEFHEVISKMWNEIEKMIESNNLLNVYLDRIEAIK